MRKYYEEQLQQLDLKIIKMGSLIEKAIENSVKSIVERDMALAQEVSNNDNEIDNMEKDIEKLCISLILHQQPMARDLREISCALKIITDMERIGDQAEDIAEITQLILEKDYKSGELNNIINMAKEAISMTKRAITSFVSSDTALAKEVIEYDDVVDGYFNTIKEGIVEMLMQEGKTGADSFVNLLLIAKYLERIADHATNIAEWTIYKVTGQH